MDEQNLKHHSLSVWNENGSLLGSQESAYSLQFFRSEAQQGNQVAGWKLPKISRAESGGAYLAKVNLILRKTLYARCSWSYDIFWPRRV